VALRQASFRFANHNKNSETMITKKNNLDSFIARLFNQIDTTYERVVKQKQQSSGAFSRRIHTTQSSFLFNSEARPFWLLQIL